MRTLQEVVAIFENENCKLLSTEYKNSKTKVHYLTQCGHENWITLDNFRKGKGRLCKTCSLSNRASKRKYDINYVKQFFDKEGCKLLSEEYENANRQKLRYIAQCGHENNLCFSKFAQGAGRVCSKCSHSIKYEYAYVKESFEEKGCQLLDSDYINCKTPMRYIATCGHIATITFDDFKNTKTATLRCRDCQKIKHYTIEKVIEIFETNGCELISKSFTKEKDKLEYYAQCGHINHITLDKFLAGQGRQCRACSRPRGENHHSYNETLTEQDRQQRDMQNAQFRALRKKVFQRDNFSCCVCHDSRGGNLVAHHLDGWNTNPDKRFSPENLITLCTNCHMAFHSLYGYGDNTRVQFEEYAISKKENSNASDNR